MKPLTKIEHITPAKATEYLKRNKINRPRREMLVEQYALDMRKGHWLFNHQGIAFDENGNLLDGQHRLAAIALSGVTIPILVTTGLPQCVENGLKIFTMDTVDGGKKRSIGDQFTLHGQANGNHVAACCSAIAHISTGNYVKLTVPTGRAIFSIYKKEIDHAVSNRANQVGIRSCCVIGAISFALKSDFEKVDSFYSLLVSGEGIYKTGETSPIYTLRKFLTSPTGASHIGGASARIRVISATLNAVRHYVEGYELAQLKHTSLGLEFFVGRQKSSVSKVCEIVTI